jgi:hypothetical protein
MEIKVTFIQFKLIALLKLNGKTVKKKFKYSL